METPPVCLTTLIHLFIVVYMLSVALETTPGQIRAALKDVNMMGRALLANLIIVPILGVILVHLFSMSPYVKIGFLLLALSPGGLFALQFARVAQGNRIFAVVLLFVLSVLAVFFTPTLIHLLFPTSGAGRLPFVRIILLLLLFLVVPLFFGRALQQLVPAAAPKLSRLLGTLSVLLFILATVMTGQYKSPAIKAISTGGRENATNAYLEAPYSLTSRSGSRAEVHRFFTLGLLTSWLCAGNYCGWVCRQPCRACRSLIDCIFPSHRRPGRLCRFALCQPSVDVLGKADPIPSRIPITSKCSTPSKSKGTSTQAICSSASAWTCLGVSPNSAGTCNL
jgi:hypothetical protein